MDYKRLMHKDLSKDWCILFKSLLVSVEALWHFCGLYSYVQNDLLSASVLFCLCIVSSVIRITRRCWRWPFDGCGFWVWCCWYDSVWLTFMLCRHHPSPLIFMVDDSDISTMDSDSFSSIFAFLILLTMTTKCLRYHLLTRWRMLVLLCLSHYLLLRLRSSFNVNVLVADFDKIWMLYACMSLFFLHN